MRRLISRLDRHREIGPVFVRAVVGLHLIWNTADNVVSWARMLEFRDFLAHHGFPLPLLAAQVSVWAQFLCGGLFILGLFTRTAAALMTFNFVVALLMVHIGLPYEQNFPALMMLATALFLLFHGPGSWSLDAAIARRRAGAGARPPGPA